VIYESIASGERAIRRYTITPEVYANFLDAFEDSNRIHVDDDYARSRGFKGRVMHGAILNGFLSHFVGVHLAEWRALLLSAEMRYSNASYLNDILEMRGTVLQKVDALRVIVLGIEIANLTQGKRTGNGRAQVQVERA
jgi:acyl dehydratase